MSAVFIFAIHLKLPLVFQTFLRLKPLPSLLRCLQPFLLLSLRLPLLHRRRFLLCSD